MKFNLGTILTITTGKFLCEDFGLVYQILDHMTQDKLSTHQLGRCAQECVPYLLDQFPALEEIDVSDVNKNNYEEWMQRQISIYGNEFDVLPIPKDDHDIIDPVEEYKQMTEDFDGNNLIQIDTSDL